MVAIAIPIGIAIVRGGVAAYRLYRAYQAAKALEAIANQLSEARKASEELDASQERDRACDGCATEIPCFDPPPNGDKDELKKQLDDQQDAINNMSPEQLLEQIGKYKQGGRNLSAPGEAAARQAERRAYERARTRELTRQFRRDRSLQQAQADAAAQTARELKDLNVLHTPDLRAGGTGQTGGLGGASVNQHIGRQWKNGRADALEKAARGAEERGEAEMNVELEPC